MAARKYTWRRETWVLQLYQRPMLHLGTLPLSLISAPSWTLHADSGLMIRIAERACRALKGEKGLRECTFVYLPGIDGGKEIAETIGVDYFSAPVEFGVSEANTHAGRALLSNNSDTRKDRWSL